MNCDDAIELLPWLLNATLEPEEERAVRSHLATCARCRQALEESRFAWTVFGEHVPTEALVAHAFDDLPPGAEGADKELLERHLATCPRCAAELEMVRASRLLGEHEDVAILPVRPAAPAAVPAAPAAPARYRAWRSSAVAAGLVGAIAAAGWIESSGRVRSLEQQIAAERPPVTVPAPVPGPAPEARIAELERERARLAAEAEQAQSRQRELAVQLEEVKRQVAALPQEPAAAGVQAFVDLYPSTPGRVRGGEAGGARGKVVPRSGVALLYLHTDATGAARRRFEVLDAAGRVVDRGEGLMAQEGDDFYTLALDTRRLAAGRYTLRLLGPAEELPFVLK